MRERVLHAILLAVLALGAGAACISDRDPPTAAETVDCTINLPTSADPAIRARVAAAPGDSVAIVVIQDYAFYPDTVRIPAGATVVWINCEPPTADPHTTTSDAAVWSSEFLQRGDAFGRRFADTGDFPYHCIPHPFMRGVILVSP